MNKDELWALGIASIKSLETDWGVLASGRGELFGCVFGRDSLITSLSLLKVYRKTGDAYFLQLVNKVLMRLAELQGRAINIENGEEPGKCIHEFRLDKHEHLTRALEPWHVSSDGSMRNYDSVDATPLFLMALYEYLSVAPPSEDAAPLLRAAHRALAWLTEHGDSNRDGFIDYRFHPDRKHGGLRVQSWMDSSESLFFEIQEEKPAYAIAPVEVQAYAYVALLEWADYFSKEAPTFSRDLLMRAGNLKRRFNSAFVLPHGKSLTLAFAVDGNGRRLTSARSSMAHVLWAVRRSGQSAPDGILDASLVPKLVKRLLSPDLYVPSAGIRTLSSRSRRFNPVSYHNGSIWPHDTELFAAGLENYGYREDAERVRAGLLRSYRHFKTPIELFGYRRGFREYEASCRVQAWSAAAILSGLA